MRLTEAQTHIIIKHIEQSSVFYEPLKTELIDELASAIEVKMLSGSSFEKACMMMFGDIKSDELEIIQKKVLHTLKSNHRLRKFHFKQAFYLFIGLSAWVIIEFLIGLFIGVKELGAMYGALSILIIAFALFRGLSAIIRDLPDRVITFKTIFLSGTKISLFSAIIFAAFLGLFWTFIHPDFYAAYQMEYGERVTHDRILVSSIVGSATGCLIIGMGATLAIGVYHRLSNKRIID